MGTRDKYRPRYAKQLLEGMCDDGKSILKCCKVWGVSPTAWYHWIEKYPQFKYAVEIAARDRAIYWEDNFEAIASGRKKGNAGCSIFAMKNIKEIGWKENPDIVETKDTTIHRIEIVTLPAPVRKPITIEHNSATEYPDSSD